MPEPFTRGTAAAVRLQATTDKILSEVLRLPPELITWVPGEGVWSAMDIVCHVREFVPFWTGEAVHIARRRSGRWGRDHTDTARLAAVTNTAAYRLEEVVAEVRQAVRRSAATLSELSDAALAVEATSKNPRWGVKPASFVVDHLLVEHVEKHFGQIRRNVRQFDERRVGGAGHLLVEPQ